MVYGQIAKQVFKLGWRYRKQIYRGLVAQDRAIDKAFKVGGYGLQTRRGARHGALVGSIGGSLIGYQGEDSGNAVQKTQQPSANQVDKTYNRQSGRNPIGYKSQRSYRNRNYVCSCRRKRSYNRF